MNTASAACWLRLRLTASLVLLLATLFPHIAAAAPPVLAKDDGQRTILVLGDSLSAAYGMAPEQGWVALMATRVAERGGRWTLVNLSISGLGSKGGTERIGDALVQYEPEIVAIALGANDGLRKLPVLQLQKNLASMIDAAQAANAQVLLVGMAMPPRLGADYALAFTDTYAALAKRFDISLLPFLLEPIANNPDAFQPDGLHPSAEAQPEIRDHVWQSLAPLLD